MILIYFMWRDHKTDIRVCICKMIQFFFVLLPGAPCYNYRMIPAESSDQFKGLKTTSYINYPVKTGISTHYNRVVDTENAQQFTGSLILNKKSIKTVQHQTMDIPIPFKKGLVFPKKRRNKEGRNFPFTNFTKVIIPIVVLYPKNQGRTDQVKKSFSIFR